MMYPRQESGPSYISLPLRAYNSLNSNILQNATDHSTSTPQVGTVHAL